MTIHPIDVIRRKRDGLQLSGPDIQAFIDAVVQSAPGLDKQHPANALITDAQIASFLMAVFQRGLNTRELAALTTSMRTSGEVFHARGLGAFTIDKHSTGGVGDKTSLLIAPILAAAGMAKLNPQGVPGICVPMISGRSLGHTGGTLDKLETIPGFDTQLSLTRFEQVLRHCGAALIGQTPAIVPADRVLYALRDHTGTVESPYLIAASIMSKKLAEDLDALVLDVKTGSGAFMKEYEDSRFLAELMVATGNSSGTRTVALLTTMDEPLGRYSGNWVEVLECVAIMDGERHALSADLISLTLTLSGWMLYLAGHAESARAGAVLADQILSSGAAFKAFLRIVEAQGGDVSMLMDTKRRNKFHKPAAQRTLCAESAGYLASIDCTEAGWAVQRLGAGRTVPGGPVSAHAGIEVHAKLGNRITEGQPLVTLFAEDEALLAEPYEMLRATYRIAQQQPTLQALVREVIETGSRTTGSR